MKPCRLVSSQEPVLPISLLEANKNAISKKKRKEAKANAKFMHRIPDTEFIRTPNYKVLTLTRTSRPTTRFVNVGSAFMNARELAKREVASQHKSRVRAKRKPGPERIARRKELRKRYLKRKANMKDLKKKASISKE